MAEYSKMKVVELKAELKRLGLPQNGLKAELVARLEEAAASEDDGDPAADNASPDEETTADAEFHEAQSFENAKTTHDQPEASLAESATDTTREKHEELSEPVTAVAQGRPKDDPQAQTILSVTSSEVPSRPATEVIQDVQKRKRRSTTPPPAEDVGRKRLRQGDSGPSSDAALVPTSSSLGTLKPGSEDSHKMPLDDVDMEIVHDKESTNRVPELDENERLIGRDPTNGVEEIEDTHIGHGRNAATEINDTHVGDVDDNVMTDAGAPSHLGDTHPAANEAPGQEMFDDPRRSSSPERDIEPSIHPATSALYIKNFMRPLRPQTVQEHLLELATPANAPLDPSIIVGFYLDTIRTHAFAVFTSISAASRVRTALHKRVWPDESTRKALWIDFIPSKCFDDWIDIEQQARNKGNMSRYEVVYDRDEDGNVVAKLEETDVNQAGRRGPVSPVSHPDRKASIPTGPSRPSGIENAPTGPRNPYSHNGPTAMYSNRQDKLDPGFVKTISNPPVLYRPVAPELAQRRLDRLVRAKDPSYNEESGRDYHRYYFERDDILVNRGPEIFLGIRPPHREKERRELARTGGGDPRDRSHRDRRGPFGPFGGGGGNGGRRRRRAPRPHGVPRGGDRFRPGSSYDTRSGPDDRRDNYGGGRRGEAHRY
ncbi:putative sap domain-containing protein [Rosellinia necatrix]|uniref:Putative sap domain-containing protein n=1 Tax=Rosellinia necatrix TaxID=77044 RepID=A0A1S7UHE4_ROSNE|nr:putative sap domain-containing protein [Rosellinia necatrix]